MGRNWDEFGDGPTGTKRGATYVSMNQAGEIVMNRLIFEQLERPEAVILLFDHETDTIGVRPTSPLMPNAFPVMEKGNCGHRRIRARGFVRKHDIRLDGTVRFRTAAVEDGILVLDLRQMAKINRGRRLKRVRKMSRQQQLSSLSGLKQTQNDYGRDIWIEEEDEHTGKPKIWYSFDSKGRKQKHVRDNLGVSISRDEV